jgi:hypothetical protein
MGRLRCRYVSVSAIGTASAIHYYNTAFELTLKACIGAYRIQNIFRRHTILHYMALFISILLDRALGRARSCYDKINKTNCLHKFENVQT